MNRSLATKRAAWCAALLAAAGAAYANDEDSERERAQKARSASDCLISSRNPDWSTICDASPPAAIAAADWVMPVQTRPYFLPSRQRRAR